MEHTEYFDNFLIFIGISGILCSIILAIKTWIYKRKEQKRFLETCTTRIKPDEFIVAFKRLLTVCLLRKYPEADDNYQLEDYKQGLKNRIEGYGYNGEYGPSYHTQKLEILEYSMQLEEIFAEYKDTGEDGYVRPAISYKAQMFSYRIMKYHFLYISKKKPTDTKPPYTMH